MAPFLHPLFVQVIFDLFFQESLSCVHVMQYKYASEQN